MFLVPQAFLVLPQRTGLQTDQKRSKRAKNPAQSVRRGPHNGRMLRRGPHISGGGLTMAERAPDTSLPITIASCIRLLRPFFSMKIMILLFILLPRNLHNTTLKNIKNIKSLGPFHRSKSKRRLPSGCEIHLSHPQT